MRGITVAVIISVLALIISLLALLMGVAAYNRSGEDIDAVVDEKVDAAVESARQEFDRTAENLRLAAARNRAQARLIVLKTRIEANESRVEVAEEIIEIKRDLERAYKDTKGDAKVQWEELDSGLTKLEDEVRDGAADAVSTLETLIDLLEEEVRRD